MVMIVIKIKIRGIKSDKKKAKEIENWIKTNVPNLDGIKFGEGSLSKGVKKGEGPKPKGEDWEAIIAVGMMFNNKSKYKGTPEWDRAEKYWNGYDEVGKKLALLFTKQGIKKLEQLGNLTFPLNKEWEGKNKTPKTDLLGDGKRKISLKKAGGSQLMSAKREEGIATFKGAMSLMSKESSKQVQDIIDIMKNETMDLSASDYKGSIGDLEKTFANKKTLNPADKKQITNYMSDLKNARVTAEKLNNKLENFFNKDILFKKYFVYEAATGEFKFNDSVGTARELVEFDPDKISITKWLKLKNVNDATDMATKTKFYVSFKLGTRTSTPYLALRSGTRKVKLNNSFETFAEIINDECSKYEIGRELLQESNVQQLNEFQVWDKIKRGVKSMTRNVSLFFKDLYNAITKRLTNAFDSLKRFGSKMLQGLLRFFGIEVQNVSIGGDVTQYLYGI